MGDSRHPRAAKNDRHDHSRGWLTPESAGVTPGVTLSAVLSG
jgi:hypothetical protein